MGTCKGVPEPFEHFLHASSNFTILFCLSFKQPWALAQDNTLHAHAHTDIHTPIKYNCDSIIHDTLSKHQGIKVVVHLQVMEDSKNSHCTSVHEEGKKRGRLKQKLQRLLAI